MAYGDSDQSQIVNYSIAVITMCYSSQLFG